MRRSIMTRALTADRAAKEFGNVWYFEVQKDEREIFPELKDCIRTIVTTDIG